VAGIFWPGIPMYDTVSQYDQVLSNELTDWHPPVMVRLWQLLHPLAAGTAPMFVLQVALYALGFGLIFAALVRCARPFAAVTCAIVALSPLLLGWQMVVLKDCQMLGTLIAAIAIVAYYRLSSRPLPLIAAAAAALLFAYATLVRANAVFATAPLVALLVPFPRSMIGQGAVALAAIVLLLLVSPSLDHRVFRAEPSGVEKSLPVFDLAAIAVASPASPSRFTAAERAEIARRHCVKAYFWDPLGDPNACGPATARLQSESDRALYLDWGEAVVARPLAYAEHRLQHWNSTERWLVPPNLQEAAPPDEAEPNDLGLNTPSNALMPAWQSLAAAEAGTPFGWPILWTVIALAIVPIAWRRRHGAEGGIALALIASVLTLEASFLVVSIASDIRYHLWSMAASALALILLSGDLRLSRREVILGTALIVLVIGGGLVTRWTLPPAPHTYEAMIVAPSG
jgi:hypothetical protein